MILPTLSEMIRIALLSILLSGCATTIEYKPDRFKVPVPHVNGKPYPMTDAERKAIAESFLDFYCV